MELRKVKVFVKDLKPDTDAWLEYTALLLDENTLAGVDESPGTAEVAMMEDIALLDVIKLEIRAPCFEDDVMEMDVDKLCEVDDTTRVDETISAATELVTVAELSHPDNIKLLV